jgi:hypothetical protein
MALDGHADPGPNAIGVPSAALSLGWMLASRANLRFTRLDGDTPTVSRKQEQPNVAGPEDWQKCS